MADTATSTSSAALDPTAILNQVLSAVKAGQGTSSVGITTDVGAVANAIAELAKLAQTPEGQATLAQWRTDSVKAGAWIENAAKAVVSWFKGIFH